MFLGWTLVALEAYLCCAEKSGDQLLELWIPKGLNSHFPSKLSILNTTEISLRTKLSRTTDAQNIFPKMLAFYPKIINNFTSNHTQLTVIHELSIHLLKVTVLFRNWSGNRNKPSLWTAIREYVKGFLYGHLEYIFKLLVNFF